MIMNFKYLGILIFNLKDLNIKDNYKVCKQNSLKLQVYLMSQRII